MFATNLRPLSVGEIIDRSFTLYRRNFVLFFAISAIPHILTLATGLVQTFFISDLSAAAIQGARANPLIPSGTQLLFSLVSGLIALFVYLFAQGGTILAVTEIYLGRTTSISRSLGRVWDELGTLFGVAVLNGMAVAVSFLCLVIPAIYVACRLLVCVPAALIENLGPRESLSRSFELTRDNAGRAFLIMLVFVAISFGSGSVTGLTLIPIIRSHNDPAVLRLWTSLTLIVQAVTNSLVTPVLLISTSVFYFDLRIRKEAFDLQFMMDPTSEHISRVRQPGSIL